MPMTSPRTLGVMLSGAALAGWVAGSTLNPPVADMQAVAARPAPPPVARIDAPHVAWPAIARHVAPPAPSRNPFLFHGEARALNGHAAGSLAPTAERDDATAMTVPPVVEAAPVAAEPRWRLSGIAASDDGDVVAVISGAGDVFLMRAGDTLPGGDDVVEVGPAHVVVRTALGSLTLRLP